MFTYDAFLCHSSKDKDKVRKLAEDLGRSGLKVWFDEWAVKAADDIVLSIESGLASARTLVLCMSPNAFDSDWVTLERNTTIFRDPANKERRFVPLLLTSCDIPETIRRFKYIDYRNEAPERLAELLSACRPKKDVDLFVNDSSVHGQRAENLQTRDNSEVAHVCASSKEPAANGDEVNLEHSKFSPAKIAVVDSNHRKRFFLLYVDDEPQALRQFQKLFQSKYRILVAESADEAEKLLSSEEYEIGVLLTDQRMPKRKGTDLLNVARRNYPEIIRILVTAFADYDDLTSAINLGSVQGFIQKPWDPVEVEIVINRSLDAHYLEREKKSRPFRG